MNPFIFFCFGSIFSLLISREGLAVGYVFQDEIPHLNISDELLNISHTMKQINTLNSPAIPSFLRPVQYFVSRFDSEVLIAINDDARYIVVAFEGTSSLKDVLVNFYQIAFTYYGPRDAQITEAGRVHNGQNNALFNFGLYDKIEEEIKSLYEDLAYRIYITGHSQGGALALLAAPKLALSIPNANISAITFGQPRCVKQEFREWSRTIYNLAIWIFVLRDDPIPRSPKSVRGYRHAGHLIQLENEKSTLYYSFTGSQKYAGVPDTWEDKIGKLSEDHLSENYINYFSQKIHCQPELYYVSDFEDRHDYYSVKKTQHSQNLTQTKNLCEFRE